jgi:hypothetical protein
MSPARFRRRHSRPKTAASAKSSIRSGAADQDWDRPFGRRGGPAFIADSNISRESFKCAGKTGKEQVVQVRCTEGLANHSNSESCAVKVDLDNQPHTMTTPAFLNAGFCT